MQLGKAHECMKEKDYERQRDFAKGRMNLPRKSRHLDLTREEMSDAESRAEEN
jgi:hypothetical protein